MPNMGARFSQGSGGDCVTRAENAQACSECHHCLIAGCAASSQTAVGANALNAPSCVSDTVVNTGLPAAMAAANAGHSACCWLSSLPNLLRMTTSAVSICAGMAAPASATPPLSRWQDVPGGVCSSWMEYCLPEAMSYKWPALQGPPEVSSAATRPTTACPAVRHCRAAVVNKIWASG